MAEGGDEEEEGSEDDKEEGKDKDEDMEVDLDQLSALLSEDIDLEALQMAQDRMNGVTTDMENTDGVNAPSPFPFSSLLSQ
jgi:hypothetical protein